MSSPKENSMKTLLFITITAAVMCGCSSKKLPQPHGSAFPINATIQGVK